VATNKKRASVCFVVGFGSSIYDSLSTATEKIRWGGSFCHFVMEQPVNMDPRKNSVAAHIAMAQHSAATAASRSTAAAVTTTKKKKNKNKTDSISPTPVKDDANSDDPLLPPLVLQAVVIICSGFWLVIALRDFVTTGRSMLGRHDDAYLVRFFLPLENKDVNNAFAPLC
jgi:hypothetical protein